MNVLASSDIFVGWKHENIIKISLVSDLHFEPVTFLTYTVWKTFWKIFWLVDDMSV